MKPTLPSDTDEMRARARRLGLAVALVALVAHLGIGAGGVTSFDPLNYDDPQVLEIARAHSPREILSEPLWYAYKPLYFLSLKIDTLFGSATSAVAHVHNVLLHALACFLLVLLLESWLHRLWLAVAVGLVFAVHPVHVESVAWISGRKDVLSLVFALLGHLVYRRARARDRYPWATPILLLLAGLTKGTLWIWAGVLLLDELVEARRVRAAGGTVSWGAALRRWLPSALVAVGGVVLDAEMALRHGPGAVEHGVPLSSLAAAMAGVHARYVGNLLAPVGLALDYGVSPSGTWASPLAWTGALLLLAAVVLLLRAWRRGWGIGFVAAGVWLLGLLPVNNIWPRTAILMADRYLYVPALGLYVLLLAGLARRREARGVLLAIIVLGLGALTLARTKAFATSESVWSDAIEKAPQSALAWFQAGEAAAARGAWELADQRAQKAIELAPRPELLVKARLLRAGALIGRLGAAGAGGGGVPEGARVAIGTETRAALDLAESLRDLPIVRQDPREIVAEALVLRGQALELERDPAAALDAYARAARTWPENAGAHYDLATLLIQTGAEEALPLAEAHLLDAIRVRPTFLDARLQLANVLALLGRTDEALAELQRAESRHGRGPEVLFAQAQVHLAGRHDVAKAEEILTEIRRGWPQDPRAARLLGDIHLAQGRTLLDRGRAERDRQVLEQARERFESAAQAQPTRWEAEVGAGDALLELGRFPEARERYRTGLERAPEQEWIHRLVARATVLEAAWLERHATGDEARAAAAARMRRALAEDTSRIDLGLLPLQGPELDWLRAVAEEGVSPLDADAVLRAAALAVTGDEQGARSRLQEALTRLGPSTEARQALDMALLLRGMLRERVGEVADARRDYTLLAERRPQDPVPALRLGELALREARARWRIAQGDPEDVERLETAARAVADASEALRALAQAHPAALEPGLVAAESEMQDQRWVDALKRLNDLRGHHPREPAVLRGQAAVYVAQYLATRVREVLDEAVRTLTKAILLDPRDPRTWLDASNVARAAGDLSTAIKHAQRAKNFELVPGGPAARSLADLYLGLGRQALEGGNGRSALEAADAAARADSARAGPWMLRGDVALAGRRYDDAFDAYRTALELEPASIEAAQGLARVHRDRARVFQLKRLARRAPPDPAELRDDWSRLDEAEREAARAAWERERDAIEQERAAWAAQELADLEAALRLDPHSDEAPSVRQRIEALRGEDEEARRQAFHAADALVEEAVSLQAQGESAAALERLREALSLWPENAKAHYLRVATVYDLLRLPGADSDEERRLERLWKNEAFLSLQALDVLDPADRFYDRHRYRGLLHEVLLRRSGSEAARQAAIAAYERYLGAAEAAARPGDKERVAFVRSRLAALER